MGHGFQSEMRAAFDETMRELKETADLAKNSVMKPLGDEGPNLADVKPRSISESVRKMLEGSDGPATAAEVAAASEDRATPCSTTNRSTSTRPVRRSTPVADTPEPVADTDSPRVPHARRSRRHGRRGRRR